MNNNMYWYFSCIVRIADGRNFQFSFVETVEPGYSQFPFRTAMMHVRHHMGTTKKDEVALVNQLEIDELDAKEFLNDYPEGIHFSL